MTTLLYVNASPRGRKSAATQAANIFLEALPTNVEVAMLNLFDDDLPEVTENIVNAKFKFAAGADLTENEAGEWIAVQNLATQFISADHCLFAIPMWNFNVPYKFKQYIDLITHPGVTFTNDRKGLASGGATVIYSRGGDYSPKNGKPDPYDFQSPYIKAWLGLVGIDPIEEVLIQGTMAGSDAQANAVQAARARLVSLAGAVPG